ncbi:MAG TPA: HAMP domain-containing sensor histidine kinase [Mycobacteriales bacterium]|jgi:signal transduction histidine kinase|nr:HAMP domain-containing sensor histidine kinase [Mycobacteriales bacterium]
MGWRWLAVGLWAASLAALAAWWLLTRRRVDTWRLWPVPAALLDAEGSVRARTGPPGGPDLAAATGVPAPGQVVRGATADGTPLAVAGFRGGALAVALPRDPVTDRRDAMLAELAPRLAHDVYTPLTAVVGHLDLLAHEPISDSARQSITVCRSEVERIATMSRDLLALTAIRGGTATRTHAYAGALAEEAVAGVLPLADEVGATVAFEAPAEAAIVDVAEGDVIRALRNLLLNALRHGLGNARRVTLRVTGTDDTVTFSVVDSGPGIPPDRLDALCQPMTRGDGATGPGSGLGLAIVAEVLRAHGSHLTVANHPDGATFAFALPRVLR